MQLYPFSNRELNNYPHGVPRSADRARWLAILRASKKAVGKTVLKTIESQTTKRKPDIHLVLKLGRWSKEVTGAKGGGGVLGLATTSRLVSDTPRVGVLATGGCMEA